MIGDLRNPSLKARHWDMIEGVLGHQFTAEQPLNLGLLIQLDAFEKTEEIQEVSSQASSEASLETMLKKVHFCLKHCEFCTHFITSLRLIYDVKVNPRLKYIYGSIGRA